MSNSNIFLQSGFLKLPLQNGVGRYVCQLQRIVLKFCKNNGNSRGMRDFIQYNMVDFAREQPGVVVYAKPRRHRSPVIVAEYLDGTRKWMSCSNMSHEEVTRWVSTLVGAKSGETIRYRKLLSTAYPSIQGPWTPFTTLPKEHEKHPPSAAYTKLIELAKEQGIKTEYTP
ncbi:mitochondrial ribosomal protein L43 [Arctopsyche grandis]|uniref:mitochondrial ribosomal protein L43 n=1 Tax=Arctopsyche grandis TaxID=121162 RepID=UPI00406D8CAC